MHVLKIGIVEDDRIIARYIRELLLECGYEVTKPADRYTQAFAMIAEEKPDLLLLDVRLQGQKDGIDVARTLMESASLPFIFLTANSDRETIVRARDVQPAAFLTKPVTRSQLFAAIEMAMATRTETDQEPVNKRADPRQTFLFVKDKDGYEKILFSNIIYAESMENYVRICLGDNRKLMVRNTFSNFITSLDSSRFIRVHRSFIVTLDMISHVSEEKVIVAGYSIPLSKTYRDMVLSCLAHLTKISKVK